MNPLDTLEELLSYVPKDKVEEYSKELSPVIKKAIPVSVHSNTLLEKSTEVWLCPACNSYIGKEDNYCSTCGQAIIWGYNKLKSDNKDK